jgi:hypothetical protein
MLFSFYQLANIEAAEMFRVLTNYCRLFSLLALKGVQYGLNY